MIEIYYFLIYIIRTEYVVSKLNDTELVQKVS